MPAKFIINYPRSKARQVLLVATYLTVCGLGFILGIALHYIPG